MFYAVVFIFTYVRAHVLTFWGRQRKSIESAISYNDHISIVVQGASLRGRPTPPATLAQEGKKYIKICEVDRGPRLSIVFS